MSSGGGWPEFVAPPEAGTGHPAERLPGTPSAGSGRASVLLLCAAVAAAVLLTLAGFLPWLNLAWSGLDPGLPAGPSRYSGLRADGTGSMVVFAGCVALGLTVACLALRRPRLLASAAAPGGVALVACVIFALRQQELGDRLAGSGPQGGLVTLRLSLGYGWFVAVLASLAVLALGLGGLAGPRKQPHRTAAGGQS